jgi:hypothetical protein
MEEVMSSIKVILLILSMFAVILVGCESPNPPIQTDTEQAEEQILPEKTSMPEPPPTPVPTNTSIPPYDKYPQSALVHPSDLILDGDFVASDWFECTRTTIGRNEDFFDLDDDTILNTASVSYCNEREMTKLKIFTFRERIYLFESGRQAARFAEKLKGFSEMYLSDNPWFDIETTSVNFGENSSWFLSASSPASKYSHIVMVEDEAVMISELVSRRKIAEEDFMDLSKIMLRTFERSQHP